MRLHFSHSGSRLSRTLRFRGAISFSPRFWADCLWASAAAWSSSAARLIQRKVPHLPVAKILPAVDGVIILMSVFIFGVEKSGYAIVSVILSGIVADRFVSGHRNACLAYIISDKYLTIGNEIMKELDRGATVVPVKGMYTSEDRNMLICAVSIKESVILKDIVADIDPTAFCIITDAEEIRGEGFLRYTHDEL